MRNRCRSACFAICFFAGIIMETLLKYPRTPHIQGSRCQARDENLANEPFTVIADRYLVIEEKVDGANAAMSFDQQGQLLLQSRGHFLTGGSRERHFNPGQSL
jgi:hypothetical protein